MKFLEKDLEQIIYESNKDTLYKNGLYIGGRIFRQLKIGNYGIADIITVEKLNDFHPEYSKSNPTLLITVYELKKDKIGISALLQSIGYLKGIKNYLSKRKFYNYELKIVLIGSEIDTSGNFCYITDLICNLNVEPQCSISSVEFYNYNFSLDGLIFNCMSGYKLNDEGF